MGRWVGGFSQYDRTNEFLCSQKYRIYQSFRRKKETQKRGVIAAENKVDTSSQRKERTTLDFYLSLFYFFVRVCHRNNCDVIPDPSLPLISRFLAME